MALQQVKTFEDIYSRVQEELKVQSADTTNLNRIKRIINEIYTDVLSFAQWEWLRGRITLIHETALTTGTASVTEGSTSVTLSSAPALSRAGYLFSVDGSNETYRITSHTGGATSLILDYPFLGSTAATAAYKIWSDALPLPVDAREAIHVAHENSTVPLDGVGLQDFRNIVSEAPKDNGRPRCYTTSDYVDSTPYSAVGGIPSSVSRASAGVLKTLVFNTTVAALLAVGDRIKISGAGHYSYTGEFIISDVSTTTIQYVGTVPYTESTTADTAWTLTLANVPEAEERYRELLVHPSINTTQKTALKVDYIKEVALLDADADEPLIPISDRIVLVYGALMIAWSSIMRSDPDSQRNAQLYDRKLSRMAGRLKATTDQLRFVPSREYLERKRRQLRTSYGSKDDSQD